VHAGAATEALEAGSAAAFAAAAAAAETGTVRAVTGTRVKRTTPEYQGRRSDDDDDDEEEEPDQKVEGSVSGVPAAMSA
jgi:hypothetical protein